MLKGSKIKPFLWFEDQAEDAARFYTSVFRKSKLGSSAAGSRTATACPGRWCPPT
jgi:predicted 3-demethylubiquinone-9 3-methyltransferase (glyoxalase superfamily)